MSEKEELEMRLLILHKRLRSLLYCQERDVKRQIRMMLFELEGRQKRITRTRLKPSQHVEP